MQAKRNPKLLFLLIAGVYFTLPAQQVTVTSGVDEGRPAILVTTPVATYFMDIEGGGLSSLVDNQGVDWIGYSSQNAYRGIPNLRFPANVFHPGHDKCTTWVESQNDEQVVLVSRTKDSKWRCRWIFYSDYATCIVEKVDRSYWFLYEGGPGGDLDKQRDFWITSAGDSGRGEDGFGGDLPFPEWVVFGDSVSPNTLFLLHHEDDTIADTYFDQGTMTVFGFGRSGGGKLLEDIPQHFSIGFLQTNNFDAISTKMHQIVEQDPIVAARKVPLQPVAVHAAQRAVAHSPQISLSGRVVPKAASVAAQLLFHKKVGNGATHMVPVRVVK